MVHQRGIADMYDVVRNNKVTASFSRKEDAEDHVERMNMVSRLMKQERKVRYWIREDKENEKR